MNLQAAIKRNRDRAAKARVAWLDMRREYLRGIITEWFGGGWETGNMQAQAEYAAMQIAFGCRDEDYPATCLRTAAQAPIAPAKAANKARGRK